MTFASFRIALEGYVRAHSPTDKPADVPGDDDFLQALAEEMAAGRA